MIDFEDDPLEVMSLEQAQARDWLAYLHSSARLLGAASLARQAAAIDMLRAELARERAPMRRLRRRRRTAPALGAAAAGP